jgi:hypothetical protein
MFSGKNQTKPYSSNSGECKKELNIKLNDKINSVPKYVFILTCHPKDSDTTYKPVNGSWKEDLEVFKNIKKYLEEIYKDKNIKIHELPIVLKSFSNKDKLNFDSFSKKYYDKHTGKMLLKQSWSKGNPDVLNVSLGVKIGRGKNGNIDSYPTVDNCCKMPSGIVEIWMCSHGSEESNIWEPNFFWYTVSLLTRRHLLFRVVVDSCHGWEYINNTSFLKIGESYLPSFQKPFIIAEKGVIRSYDIINKLQMKLSQRDDSFNYYKKISGEFEDLSVNNLSKLGKNFSPLRSWRKDKVDSISSFYELNKDPYASFDKITCDPMLFDEMEKLDTENTCVYCSYTNMDL